MGDMIQSQQRRYLQKLLDQIDHWPAAQEKDPKRGGSDNFPRRKSREQFGKMHRYKQQ